MSKDFVSKVKNYKDDFDVTKEKLEKVSYWFNIDHELVVFDPTIVQIPQRPINK